MTSRAVATGLWLTISQRLSSSEFVQITGFGVEKIEQRAHYKPGGLLRELERYKRDGDDWDGMWCLKMFIAIYFTHPYDKHATGQSQDYWMRKLGE